MDVNLFNKTQTLFFSFLYLSLLSFYFLKTMQILFYWEYSHLLHNFGGTWHLLHFQIYATTMLSVENVFLLAKTLSESVFWFLNQNAFHNIRSHICSKIFLWIRIKYWICGVYIVYFLWERFLISFLWSSCKNIIW